jgi:hypothetical protein
LNHLLSLVLCLLNWTGFKWRHILITKVKFEPIMLGMILGTIDRHINNSSTTLLERLTWIKNLRYLLVSLPCEILNPKLINFELQNVYQLLLFNWKKYKSTTEINVFLCFSSKFNKHSLPKDNSSYNWAAFNILDKSNQTINSIMI